MRYVNLFLIYFKGIFQERARIFVWFLLSLFQPISLFLFWKGTSSHVASWNLSYIFSYYILLILVSSLLMSHIEDVITKEDIREGDLITYLLKPTSFFWLKFQGEIPYRIIQGGLGICTFIIFYFFVGRSLALATSPDKLLFAVVIAALGYMVSYCYKITYALLAFWITDFGAVYQTSEMLLFILGGFILPLYLLPSGLQYFAYILPYGYMIYFPIIAFQGQLTIVQLTLVIGIQIIWIVVLGVLYKLLWYWGVRRFMAFGQ